MNNTRRVAKNFVSLSAAELASRFLGNLLSLFVARHLGDTVFGQFAFAIAFVSFFGLFADFGLTTLGIREIAKDKKLTNSLVTNIEALQVGLAVLLFILLGLVILFLPIDWRTKWLVVFFGLGMVPQALNIAFVFQAHERMEWSALVRVVSQLGYVVLGFLIVVATRDIFWLPILLAVTSMLGVGLALWGARRVLAFRIEGLNWQVMKGLIKQAAPFVVSGIAIQVYYNLDSVLLKFWKGDAIVGQYNAAYKISLIIIMLNSMMVGAIFPLLSASFVDDRAKFDRVVKEWARISGLIAWPIVVGGVLLAKPILLLVFDRPEYAGAALAFQILIVLPLLIFWSSVYGQSLVAAGRERLTMYGLILGAVVNLIANFLLIPVFSLNGAAMATVTAELAVLIFLGLAYYRQLGMAMARQFLVRPGLAALVMGLMIWLVRHSLPVMSLVVLGGVVYSVVLVAIGGVGKQDLQFILQQKES